MKNLISLPRRGVVNIKMGGRALKEKYITLNSLKEGLDRNHFCFSREASPTELLASKRPQDGA